MDGRKESSVEQKSIDRYLERASGYIERQLNAEYDPYESDHPISEYVKNVFVETTGASPNDWNIVVTSGWDSENACALPNKTIFISDRMLQFVDSKEELAFVLKHEYTHILRQHSRKALQDQRSHNLSDSYKKLKEDVGRSRLHEYEADIRSVAEKSERPFNQYGAIRFFEKLTEKKRTERGHSDLEHGSDFKRLINMHYFVRLVDSDALRTELTPLPEEIVAAIAPKQSCVTTLQIDPFVEGDAGKKEYQRDEALAEANLEQLSIALPTIYEQWTSAHAMSELYKGENIQLRETHARYFATAAIERYHKEIKKALTDIGVSAADRPLYAGLAAVLRVGLPIDDIRDPDSPMSVFAEFDEYFEDPEDFIALPEKIRQLANHSIGLYASPINFCRFIIRGALDFGTFDSEDGACDIQQYLAYCEEMTEAILCAYGENGLVTAPSKEELFSILAAHIALTVERDALPAVIATIEKDTKNSRNILIKEIKRITGISDDSALTYEKTDTPQALDLLLALANHSASETKKSVSAFLEKQQFTTVQNLVDYVIEHTREISSAHYISIVDTFADNINTIVATKHVYMANNQTPIQRSAIGVYIIRSLQCRIHWYDALIKRKEYIEEQSAIGLMSVLNLDPINGKLLSNVEYIPNEAVGKISIPQIIKFHDLLYNSSEYSENNEDSTEIFDKEDSKFTGVYDVLFTVALLQHLESASREEFFATLHELLPYAPTISSETRLHMLSDAIFSRYAFSSESVEEMEQCITAGAFIADGELASLVQQWAIENTFTGKTHEEIQDLLFNDPRTKGNMLIEIRKKFVDQEMRDPKDLRKAVEKIARAEVIDQSTTQQAVAEGIFGQEIIATLLSNPVDFLIVGLNTAKNDEDFVSAIVEANTRVETDIFGKDKESILLETSINAQVNRFYNLDHSTRIVLIQELLIGGNGVLHNKKDTKKLVNELFANHINTDDPTNEGALLEGVHDAIMATVQSADTVSLYFMLAPLLQKRLLRRPKDPADIEKIIDRASILEELADNENAQEKMRKCLRKSLGGNIDIHPNHYIWAKHSAKADTAVRKAIPIAVESKPITESINVVEFIKSVAGTLGAPGVRLLQVAGQYLPMSANLENAFSTVYDRVPGQSKLSGFYTLDKEYPQLDENIYSIGQEIGGGSMATVWEAKTTNGDEVIKVLNPNVGFFVEKFCDILEKTFEHLADKRPRESRLGLLAVRDIRQWILSDINYENFLHHDKQFHQDHHGFTVEESRYTVQIPQSYGSESKKIKREEKIEGKNLTHFDELVQDGHDMQDIARVVVANAIKQIMLGQVHSDFHPGNIRISPKNTIAILDRNNFVHLMPEDQSLFMAIASGDPTNIAQTVTTYLEAQPENEGQKNIATVIELQLKRFDGSRSGADDISKLIVALKEGNIYVPLQITIIIKNLMALDRFCKKVGFAGVMDALA